jgi:hypothetical protein
MKISNLVRRLSAGILVFAAQLAFGNVNIFVQPQNQSVFTGSNAVFSATTTTTGETITGYTWLFSTNSVGPFSAVAGATTATLSITNAQLTDSGFYFLRVSYHAGTNAPTTVSSTLVTLTVLDRVRIVTQPAGLTRAVGAGASFTVSAAGQTPYSYQWRFNGTNLVNGARISGATTTNLVMSNLALSDTGNYDVVVANGFSSATSEVAVLTVLLPPSVSVQPTNTFAITGNTVVLSATVLGNAPLTYRWRRNGVNLSNGGRISGATTSVLTISNAQTNDSGVYNLFISNLVGSTNSANATLTVLAPPVVTSASATAGKQGAPFSFTLTATGSSPISFAVDTLPAGLGLTNGIISGTPSGFGVFNVDIAASNAAATTHAPLQISIEASTPGIFSGTSVSGKQGVPFSYTIESSNQPVVFSATSLPVGLSLDPATGIISGVPITSGTFSNILIGVSNQFGADAKNLLLTIASSVPRITSAPAIATTENTANFSYTITATDTTSNTVYGASNLSAGLVLDPATGKITGTPVIGGTNDVTISARNAWGTGSTNLQIQIAYAPVQNVFITDVTWNYSSPYLLDFTFSLRDNRDPSLGRAIVRPANQISVVCIEGDTNSHARTPIGNETTNVLSPAVAANAKQLKTGLVLDYTYSLFIETNAIDAMQKGVETLIDQEPGVAQFAVTEFHADDTEPTDVIPGFTSDKMLLKSSIEGIRTNLVKGNYAGSRLYDALYATLTEFGPTNNDEQRYIVVMSDGYDDSSVLPALFPDAAPLTVLINAAKNSKVQIYCVGYGSDVNTTVLTRLATQTGGRYFAAATAGDVAGQFALLQKDLNSQYFLRWATLQRGLPFQPMFTISVDGVSATYNPDFPTQVIDTNQTPAVTNVYKIDFTTTPPTTNELSAFAPDFDPGAFGGNVLTGNLRLEPDSETNISYVMLRAFYVPRFVREFRIHYRPNYPCTPILPTGLDGLLNGWLMDQSDDGTNGFWLTLTSTNTSDVRTSLPYGIRGDLVKFQFAHQAVPSPINAFSLFEVDNDIYTNTPPSGQTFTLDAAPFVTVFDATPPFGTPVPWLLAAGFTSDFASAETNIVNGMPLWQRYLAGFDPTDTTSTLQIQVMVGEPAAPNQLTFGTVSGKTYRVETATEIGNWITLQDGISGTGGDVTIFDQRDLSSVGTVFYRLAVY